MREQVIHDPTLSDALLVQHGITLTAPSHGKPTLAKTQAEQRALSLGHVHGGHVHSALLADLHDVFGNPVQGYLVWIVDISPARGMVTMPDGRGGRVPVKYEFVILNARPADASGHDSALGVYLGG